MTIDDIKNVINDRPLTKIKPSVSTGSTMLNLACSDDPFAGFMQGSYYLLVGDSSSGKTFLSMTCFAEACLNDEFKDHRLIYDDVENGCLMDVERFFGTQVKERLEAPKYDNEGLPEHSTKVEEFYYNIHNAIEEGKPFIYVLDSMDGLSSESEQEKFNEQKAAFEKGKTTAGSYGDGKAKKNSENLRKIMSDLKRTNSILIIISQTRDNLGMGFEKKTRSGGKALRFYATNEIWTSVAGKINKTVDGTPRHIGNYIKAQIRKNRTSGWSNDVKLSIYPSYGIDDVGSCIDYLIEEGHWKKSKQSYIVPEFDFEGRRETLIDYIEENNKIKELREITGQVWNETKEKCSLKRKKRYE